ncbi:MAG TPA: D-glycerate dehydrogenase, partial [Chloroflexota bacterium]|nr:D-glycerate dehydrogenase [Chloroflexota bacterium]
MATARRVVEGMDYVRSGQWTTWGPLLLLGQDIHHATLGLVGLGRIGTEMAKRAKGFDMRVIYYDAFRRQDKEPELGLEYLPLEDVLRQADFVSLHTPLTPETQHLMNARTLALMKPTAILINTSRGPVIDPDALYDALKAGTIRGAGLDVTEPEPLPQDHKLLTLPNCVVVPHIASASVATRDAMAVLAAENLFAGLEGKPLEATPNPDVKPRFR